MDLIKDVSKGYQVVENLGHAARGNIGINEMIVLQNGVQFKLAAKLGNDSEKKIDSYCIGKNHSKQMPVIQINDLLTITYIS